MNDYPIETRLLIDGVEATADPNDLRDGLPTWLDGMSLTWGRSSNVEQPEVGTCTFVLRQQLVGNVSPMLDVIKVGATVEVWSDITTDDGVVSVPVWSGAVASAIGQAAGYAAVEFTVVASDAAAPLADETIGDDPWPVQTVGTRVDRILELAQTDTAPIQVDPALLDFTLTYRDVDAQPVLGLLQEIADSVGGVLWVATDVELGTYMWIEDPSRRAALRQFLVDAETGLVTISNNTRGSEVISAADLLRDPIQWTQDKAQVINSVDVTWQRQDTDNDGKPSPTSKTITVTQGTPAIIRKLGVETQLTTQLDASALASRLIALVGSTNGWIASGLSINTVVLQRNLPDLGYSQRLSMITQLLDGTARLGKAITLIDLPEWTPGGDQASVYLEGGTYTLSNGRWILDLTVSAVAGQGQSATFADFDGTGVRLMDFEPSIQVADAWGVAGPNATALGMGSGLFGSQTFGA